MCIVFISTSHPDYSLILIDNRDEFVLRPTSRPRWWKHPATGREILSSQDLFRPEKGTWLGITRQGQVAVLTNYREAQATGPSPKGKFSRGTIVSTFLGQSADEGLRDSVASIVEGGKVQDVGGFSMVCGKLRRKSEGFAVVSNRAGDLEDVPIVAPERAGGWGLTNTAFDKSNEWPKVAEGTVEFNEIVASHRGGSEEDFIQRLFALLDKDTLYGHEERSLEENIRELRKSIFVPLLGGEKQRAEMKQARGRGRGSWSTNGDIVTETEVGDETAAFEKGMYGTQRQTVVLVDREGRVTFVERALCDANGHEIPRGEGDVTYRFKIEGWEG